MFNQERMTKESAILKGFLMGADLKRSLRAWHLVRGVHTGKRRDGSPEISHQLAIALSLARNTKRITNPDIVIALGLLHDSIEDDKLDYHTVERECGTDVARGTELLSKKYFGARRSDEEYILKLSQDENCSPVKAEDRIHNLESMHRPNGMTHNKIKEYIAETETFILPMIHKARERFIEQGPLYVDQARKIETILELSRIIINIKELTGTALGN